MKTLPQISEAEFEVMKIVWKYKGNHRKITAHYKLESQNHSDSNQAPCNQRCPYLLKKKAVCLSILPQ